MQRFFKEKVPPYFVRGGGGGEGGGSGGESRHYALSSYLFPFLKVSFLTFVVQTITFQAKLPSHCVFKGIQYGYKTFKIVLSLTCKIISQKHLTW